MDLPLDLPAVLSPKTHHPQATGTARAPNHQPKVLIKCDPWSTVVSNIPAYVHDLGNGHDFKTTSNPTLVAFVCFVLTLQETAHKPCGLAEPLDGANSDLSVMARFSQMADHLYLFFRKQIGSRKGQTCLAKTPIKQV